MGLADVITVLQVVAGLKPPLVDKIIELGEDGKVDLEEAVHALQNAADLHS